LVDQNIHDTVIHNGLVINPAIQLDKILNIDLIIFKIASFKTMGLRKILIKRLQGLNINLLVGHHVIANIVVLEGIFMGKCLSLSARE